MNLDKVNHDLDYMLNTLKCEIAQRRYESARQSAEVIMALSRAAEKMAYELPSGTTMTLKEVYGV